LDLEEIDEAAIERLRGNYKKLAALARGILTRCWMPQKRSRGKKRSEHAAMPRLCV
jgi:hypothetical protein